MLFCSLFLGQAQGLEGFCGLIMAFFFCRVELDHLCLKGLEVTIKVINAIWGQGLSMCTPRGLHKLLTSLDQYQNNFLKYVQISLQILEMSSARIT